MITIVFCYRNREIIRIKRSLDSLAAQDNQGFKVIFVDYGSNLDKANEISKLILNYPFVTYVYNDTRFMPWNRSHALNCGIRLSESEYIFTADVDMIFRSDFISTCQKLVNPDKAYFFTIYYLPPHYDLDNFTIQSSIEKSKKDALGLGLIPRKVLMEIGGYDEFYSFWGKEDNDIEQRLRIYGLETQFYQDQVLMYHMHHKPVHDQKVFVPKKWLVFQDNYFEFHKARIVRNQYHEWGYVHKRDERVCLQKMFDIKTEFINVDGTSEFLEFLLIKMLHELSPGETKALVFADKVSIEFENSFLNNFAKRINKLFTRLRIPLNVTSAYHVNFEDIYDSRDVVAHFISAHRNLLSDFAYSINDKELKVIFRKKQ